MIATHIFVGCLNLSHSNQYFTFMCSFSELSTSEWMNIFEGSNFPYGPINNLQQVFSDPQVINKHTKNRVSLCAKGRPFRYGKICPAFHCRGSEISRYTPRFFSIRLCCLVVSDVATALPSLRPSCKLQ